MPWLLNSLYIFLAAIAFPWLLLRRVRQGKRLAGWGEKFTGQTPDLAPTSERIWLHAVSVGEVLLLKRIVAELARRHPEAELVITTTTGTGFDVARREFPKITVCYFPFDFSWAVGRAMRRLKPTTILLAETEIWPNLLLAASRAGIPVGIINGRLSETSFRGYSRIRPVIAPLMRQVSGIAAQNEDYAGRFRALGYPAERIAVTGSVKYDGLQTNRDNLRTRELRAALGIAPGDFVLIAGSTQAPEEAIALCLWRRLVGKHPNLRLILVPRHRERFEEVARLVEKEGLGLCRRSSGIVPQRAERPILLLDTLGELADCWGLADIAFVGGSLTQRGGQNMIEPAAYGAAVVVGPHTENFRQTVAILHAEEAIEIVADGTELGRVVETVIEDEQARRSMGNQAQRVVSRHSGATSRTVDFLEQRVLRARGDRSRSAA